MVAGRVHNRTHLIQRDCACAIHANAESHITRAAANTPDHISAIHIQVDGLIGCGID